MTDNEKDDLFRTYETLCKIKDQAEKDGDVDIAISVSFFEWITEMLGRVVKGGRKGKER